MGVSFFECVRWELVVLVYLFVFFFFMGIMGRYVLFFFSWLGFVVLDFEFVERKYL